MRALLLPFSYLYAAAVTVRNLFFDIGILRSRKVTVPVISVGNISAGGVGKTPFVELLARRFLQRGRKVAIVSRGYGRRTKGTVVVSNGSTMCAEADAAGDEPAQLAGKLPGVVVIVDQWRSRGASYAIEHFGVNLIMLDDGFQHRYINRDLNIVLVSVEEILEGEGLLPAGNRREPWRALHRADLIVVSRIRSGDQFRRAQQRLEGQFRKPAIGVRARVSAFKEAVTGRREDILRVRGKRVIAFAGIGRPEEFELTLNSLSLDVREYFKYADHHRFRNGDLKAIEGAARRNGAEFIVTTEKDIARLSGSQPEAMRFLQQNPVFYVEIEHEVVAGEELLEQALARI